MNIPKPNIKSGSVKGFNTAIKGAGVLKTVGNQVAKSAQANGASSDSETTSGDQTAFEAYQNKEGPGITAEDLISNNGIENALPATNYTTRSGEMIKNQLRNEIRKIQSGETIREALDENMRGWQQMYQRHLGMYEGMAKKSFGAGIGAGAGASAIKGLGNLAANKLAQKERERDEREEEHGKGGSGHTDRNPEHLAENKTKDAKDPNTQKIHEIHGLVQNDSVQKSTTEQATNPEAKIEAQEDIHSGQVEGHEVEELYAHEEHHDHGWDNEEVIEADDSEIFS